LSLLNYVQGQYVVEDLFQSARRARATHVTIDLLTGIVEPEAVRTFRLDTAVESARNWLGEFAAANGCDIAVIRSFMIEMDFRFEQTRESENVPGLELPAYEARGVIVDNRGVRHVGVVPEWWRYG